MSKALHIILAVLTSMALITACEDSSPSLSGLEPKLKLEFINATKLVELTDTIEEIDEKIQDITDSLATIQTLISEGDMTDFTKNEESLDAMQIALNDNKTKFNDTIQTINSGLVRINTISSPDGAKTIAYIDSMSVFSIPLNSNSTSSLYNIDLSGTSYTLKINYERTTELVERKAIIKATNMQVVEHSFLDSIYTIDNDKKELTLYF